MYDALWLNQIRDVFSRTLTDGYLAVYPLVTALLTTTLMLLLFSGIIVAWFTSFRPIALVAIGVVQLRVMALWAVAHNWNYLFDGFMISVVTWGGLIGGSTLGYQELLDPGSLLLLGIRLTSNFYLLLVSLGEDIWSAFLLFLVYGLAYFALWGVFAIMSLALLLAQVEFQYISVFAFLMWPLMPIGFVAWIAHNMVHLLIGAALRLGGLAALYSITLPFIVDLSMGDGEPTVQSAMMFMIGLAILGYLVWNGPRMFGRAAWPGSGLYTLGVLTWAGLRR